MQTLPDRHGATGKSSAPKRPQVQGPWIGLCAAVWLIWYAHSLRTHCLHIALSKGAVSNYQYQLFI